MTSHCDITLPIWLTLWVMYLIPNQGITPSHIGQIQNQSWHGQHMASPLIARIHLFLQTADGLLPDNIRHPLGGNRGLSANSWIRALNKTTHDLDSLSVPRPPQKQSVDNYKTNTLISTLSFSNSPVLSSNMRRSIVCKQNNVECN